MKKSKSILNGISSSFLIVFLTGFLQLFFTPIILKYLSNDFYGLYIVIFQVIGYLSFFDFGLGSSVSRFLSLHSIEDEKDKINRIISSSFISFIFIGILVLIIGLYFSNIFSDYIKVSSDQILNVKRILVFLTILTFLQFLVKPFNALFFALHMQALSNILQFTTFVIQFFTSLVLLSKGYGLWSFVAGIFVSFLFNLIINLLLIKKYFPFIKISVRYFDRNLIKEMLSFGFYLFLNGLAVQIIFQTDRVLIGSAISLTAVSVYSLTVKIPEIAMGIIWKITDNTFPYLVSISSNLNSLKSIHQRLMIITMGLSVIVIGLVIIFLEDFLTLWLSEESYFLGYENLILIVSIFLILHTILHVSAICLNGAGFVKGFAKISILDALLNFAISYTLVSKIGLTGVLLGTFISGSITSFWYVIKLSMKTFDISLIEYIRPIFNSFKVISPLFILIYFFKFGYKFHFESIYYLILSVVSLSVFSVFIAWHFLFKEYFSHLIPTFNGKLNYINKLL
uniref:oligosaccharide flippase family protein n=1 Tax=Algoriphagus sp. TaxID=1872435 RepID=UPI00404732AE